jgi:mono/diheme cytochrome c family protein
MRKFLVFAVLLAVTITAIFFTSCNNEPEEEEPETRLQNKDSLDKAIKRGEYLAQNVAACIHCHSQRDFTKYGGPVVPGTEGGGGFAFLPQYGLPGTFYGKNITPDKETGIGAWSDDEVLRAITQGISKNGDTLFPLMPYANYNRMPKEDLLNIIGYLRTLKPINNKIQPRQMMMPIAMAYPAQFLQPSIDGNKRPDRSDIVKYGEYIMTMADCANCHSPLSPQGPDMSRMLAGGHVFDAGHFKVAAANISPDLETGIGSWTEERFLTKFTQYRKKEAYDFKAGDQNTVMPVVEIGGMTDEDLKALFAYIKTVKPHVNLVEKYPK